LFKNDPFNKINPELHQPMFDALRLGTQKVFWESYLKIMSLLKLFSA